MHIDWNDIVLHFAYLLFFIAYALKDVFWMRVILILGASVDIYYRYALVPDISYTDIYWCVGDIVVNVYQFIMLYRERKGLLFNDEERAMYKMVFSRVPELQYKRLLKIAEWQDVPENTVLVRQGTELDTLMIISDGLCKVEVEDKLLSYIRNGNFIGEMSFLTGNPTTANVITLMPTRMLVWNRTKLREVLGKDEDLHNAMHSVFNGDLIAKLSKHTNQTTSNAVTHSSETEKTAETAAE